MVRPGAGTRPKEGPALDFGLLDIGVDRFGGRAQSFWLKYVEDCAARSFQGSPRILASTDELVGDLGDDHADLRLRNGMLRYVIELPALRHVPSDIGVIAERLVERLGERV